MKRIHRDCWNALLSFQQVVIKEWGREKNLSHRWSTLSKIRKVSKSSRQETYEMIWERVVAQKCWFGDANYVILCQVLYQSFIRRPSCVVLSPLRCPTCGGEDLVKHGKTKKGKQRFLCQNLECEKQTFVLENAHKGRLLQTKEQIISMTLNGSGIRDISRVLKISRTTVANEIARVNTSMSIAK